MSIYFVSRRWGSRTAEYGKSAYEVAKRGLPKNAILEQTDSMTRADVLVQGADKSELYYIANISELNTTGIKHTDGWLMPITLYDYKRLPEFVYHATSVDCLEKISEHGLGANRSDQVAMGGKTADQTYADFLYSKEGFFFATDVEESEHWISEDVRLGSSDKLQVIGIPKKQLQPSKIYFDFNNSVTEDLLTKHQHKGAIDGTTIPLLTFFYCGVLTDIQENAVLLEN